MKESVYDGLRSMQGKMREPFMEAVLNRFTNVILYWESMQFGLVDEEMYLEIVQEFKDDVLYSGTLVREAEEQKLIMHLEEEFKRFLDMRKKSSNQFTP